MIYTKSSRTILDIKFIISMYQSYFAFVETQCIPKAHRESTIAKIRKWLRVYGRVLRGWSWGKILSVFYLTIIDTSSTFYDCRPYLKIIICLIVYQGDVGGVLEEIKKQSTYFNIISRNYKDNDGEDLSPIYKTKGPFWYFVKSFRHLSMSFDVNVWLWTKKQWI